MVCYNAGLAVCVSCGDVLWHINGPSLDTLAASVLTHCGNSSKKNSCQWAVTVQLTNSMKSKRIFEHSCSS